MKKIFLTMAVCLTSLFANAQTNNDADEGSAPAPDLVSSQTVVNMSNNPTVTKVPSLLGNIVFNQGGAYSSLCPMVDGKHCKTGCVITAMAQIMRYYKYPSKPTIPADKSGLIEYSTDNGQAHVSWDLSKVTFDWDNVLPSYHDSDHANKTQQKAVGTLMASVGAAVHASYGPNATGATARGRALIKYFGYDKDAYTVRFSVCNLERKCLELKNAIDNGQIAIIGSAEGHCFLIDGYDMTGAHPKFHINWGWGGKEDGFFDLNDMNPAEIGGYDNTNYSGKYSIYLNNIPENNTDDGLALSAKTVTVDKETVSAGDQVSVSVTHIGNESKDRIAHQTEYVYLVDTNSNKCYKTDAFMTMPGLNPCIDYKVGPFLDGATNVIKIPADVPHGKYYVELRRDSKDHFFTPNPATITIE